MYPCASLSVSPNIYCSHSKCVGFHSHCRSFIWNSHLHLLGHVGHASDKPHNGLYILFTDFHRPPLLLLQIDHFFCYANDFDTHRLILTTDFRSLWYTFNQFERFASVFSTPVIGAPQNSCRLLSPKAIMLCSLVDLRTRKPSTSCSIAKYLCPGRACPAPSGW